MKPRVDLNADLGEGFPWDEELLGLVTSANVCCGAHAGDRATSRRTLGLAAWKGVLVGAHPGYADREGFGRREQRLTREEVAELVGAQVAWLAELAEEQGVAIRYVKPHGALYNQAQREAEVAEGVAEALAGTGRGLLGQPGSLMEEAARRVGVRFVAEGFADRRYRSDGRLMPRSEPGAILTDLSEVAEQAVRLAREGIETICLHGDESNAVARARWLRGVLEAQGIEVRPWAE